VSDVVSLRSSFLPTPKIRVGKFTGLLSHFPASPLGNSVSVYSYDLKYTSIYRQLTDNLPVIYRLKKNLPTIYRQFTCDLPTEEKFTDDLPTIYR
jgi:hypothetical protein